MKTPSLEDRFVVLRGGLTDQEFGHTHWRAAQFSSPWRDRLGVFVVCREDEDPQVLRGKIEVALALTAERSETPSPVPAVPREETRCADCIGGYTCEALNGDCMKASAGEPRSDSADANYTHPDALMHQVEQAIRLAAKLGDDAFDFIEGRGLHAMRVQIEKDVAKLRASEAPAKESVGEPSEPVTPPKVSGNPSYVAGFNAGWREGRRLSSGQRPLDGGNE